MRRLLAAAVSSAAVVVAAPAAAPAEAATCVEVLVGWTGVCFFSDGWLAGSWIVCVYDRRNLPATYVYVPGPGSSGQTCGY